MSERDARTAGRFAWVLAPAAVVAGALQVPAQPLPSALGVLLWVACAVACDRRVARQMWQPRFLAVSLVLALLSGLLLGAPQTHVAGIPVSWTGLAAGIVMVLRGLLILGIAAWSARWLLSRADRLRAGESNAASAAATAFGLIPELGARIRAVRTSGASRPGGRLAGFERAAVTLVCEAAGLAEGLWRQTRASGRDDG